MRWTLGALVVEVEGVEGARPEVSFRPRNKAEFESLVERCGGLDVFFIDTTSTFIRARLAKEDAPKENGDPLFGPHISVRVPQDVAQGEMVTALPGMAELRKRQIAEREGGHT